MTQKNGAGRRKNMKESNKKGPLPPCPCPHLRKNGRGSKALVLLLTLPH